MAWKPIQVGRQIRIGIGLGAVWTHLHNLYKPFLSDTTPESETESVSSVWQHGNHSARAITQ